MEQWSESHNERKLLHGFLVPIRRNLQNRVAGSYELPGIGDSDWVHW